MHSLLKTSHSISLPANKVATTEAQAAGAVDLARGSTCKWKHMHTLLLVALLYALTVKKNILQYFLASKQSGRRQLVSQALSVQQVLLELVKSNVGLQQLPGKEDFASLSGCAASSNLSPCSFAGPPACSCISPLHKQNPGRLFQVPNCLLLWGPLSKAFPLPSSACWRPRLGPDRRAPGAR